MTSPEAKPARSPSTEDIRRVLLGRHPLVYVVTPEEERASRLIAESAAEWLPERHELWQWSVTAGLRRLDGLDPTPEAAPPEGHRLTAGPADPATVDPTAALAQVAAGDGAAVYIFKDLHLWLGERAVVRWLREIYQASLGRDRYLFLTAPVFSLPLEIKKDTAVIDMAPPTLQELEPVLDRALRRAAEAAAIDPLDPEQRTALLRAIQGLTATEADHVLALALADHGVGPAALRAIQAEKSRLIRKEGVLQFVPPQVGMDDVGGLDILKDWLRKRRKLFLDELDKVGDLMPRGLLMMGVSGCGKSLSVKAISSYWDLPLFRLDMSEVFSGAHGTPEDAFARALRASEAFAPCILWIDEIEGGITGYEAEHGGATWRIFSNFLTWMQEKRAPVFVAATANRIDLLPAEILRKGRFDQIFFLDLPSEEERSEIFRVHLARRGNDCTRFDMSILARGTKGWNGAEIEQCVISAMVEAYAAEQTLAKEHLYDQLGQIVPLSTTMAEQIKAIRSWAHDRALKAGK